MITILLEDHPSTTYADALLAIALLAGIFLMCVGFGLMIDLLSNNGTGTARIINALRGKK